MHGTGPIKPARASLLVVVALLAGMAVSAAQDVAPDGDATNGTPPLERWRLEEVSVGAGYLSGNLRQNPVDLEMVPVFMRFGFNVNGLFRLDSDVHTIQLAFEPFVVRIFQPATAGAAGCDLFVRYTRRVTSRLDAYLETGGGPVYWGLATYEQGRAGWNLLDQIGGGYRLAVTPRHGVFAGYRWVHVSRAGLDTKNRADRGVNAIGFVVGYTWRPADPATGRSSPGSPARR